ncbi:MAG: DUF4249 domain-containing protein [Bacteroidetes bacterium]|nr:MAG: DUF4249 domain-containing protein [Bacteroidota bacterium]
MIKSLHIYSVSLCMALGLINCTDVIVVDIEEVPPQLVIDAWINNKPEAQTIRLTLTQGYFNNTFAPGVTSAEVIVADESGQLFVFEHQGEGNYVWTPAPGETIGDIGSTFFLGVEWNGTTFASQSTLNRVPEVDSIQVEFRANELGFPDGHYAQFFSRDPLGRGDTYWIKSFKNDLFLNKPFELNIAWDAGFSGGTDSDGIIFLGPIREAINRVPDPGSEDDSDDNSEVPPWMPGDEIRVEIHSITNLAFDFLEIARAQMTNGTNTIFAIPLANTRTNIITLDGDEEALGFFCVSAISSRTTIVE